MRFLSFFADLLLALFGSKRANERLSAYFAPMMYGRAMAMSSLPVTYRRRERAQPPADRDPQLPDPHDWQSLGCGGAEVCYRCFLIFRFKDDAGAVYCYGPNSPGRAMPYECAPVGETMAKSEELLAEARRRYGKPSDGNIPL